jgi:hypothetical protein
MQPTSLIIELTVERLRLLSCMRMTKPPGNRASSIGAQVAQSARNWIWEKRES